MLDASGVSPESVIEGMALHNRAIDWATIALTLVKHKLLRIGPNASLFAKEALTEEQLWRATRGLELFIQYVATGQVSKV